MADSFFQTLQATAFAKSIAESVMLTAVFSAAHLLGFTLLMGSVLVSALRQLGAVLTERPAIETTRAADRGVLVGLTISVLTGLSLFSGRAPAAAANDIFRLKMLLLVSAALLHFLVFRRVPARAGLSRLLLRLNGAASLALWGAVALAGCAYILLE